MIRVDAWLPAAGGSYQDISLASNYRGVFLSSNSLSLAASAQFEQIAATSGALRGMLVTTGEFPIAFYKAQGFSSQTFHTNMRSWFSPYETARASGYLRVIWEDGTTELRIPARVQSIATVPGALDAYMVVLKAEQPYFEETSATTVNSPTSGATNSGNVRCGTQVDLTGANMSNCATGSGSGSYTNFLRRIDANVTPASTGRMLVNGVPVPWRTAESQHVWAIVNGSSPSLVYLNGLTGNDPLQDQFTAGQLNLTGSGPSYNYNDMRISTLLADDRLGGLWRPHVYLPASWPVPVDGSGNQLQSWGYYAEDTADGFKLYLNDTPEFGSTGDYPYNAVYLDGGGQTISSVSQWDVTLAGFTGSEAKAVLLGRHSGSDVWVEVWSSSSNGSTTVSAFPGVEELMWTIVPQSTTLTTDPSLEINPDSSTALTFGTEPDLTASSTAYKKLHGTFSVSVTGQNIVFTNFVTTGEVELHMPHRLADWDIVKPAGICYGYFVMSEPARGIELGPGSNTLSNSTGGSYSVTFRGGYG